MDSLSCDFGNDTCMWFDIGTSTWQHVQNRTSNGTYIEARATTTLEQTFILESAHFKAIVNKGVLLTYQLSGSSTVSISIQSQMAPETWRTVFQRTGDMGNSWKTEIVKLADGSLALRILAGVKTEGDLVRVNALEARSGFEDISCSFDADRCGWSGGWQLRTGQLPSDFSEKYGVVATDFQGKRYAADSYMWGALSQAGSLQSVAHSCHVCAIHMSLFCSGLQQASSFTSPHFFTATERFIEFAYYLVASGGSASLELQCLHAGIWLKLWSGTSSPSPSWGQAKVMVPAGTRELRFVGVAYGGSLDLGWWIVDAVVAAPPQTPAPHFLSLSGRYHSCALHTSTGQLKCWGPDMYGRLGYGLMEIGQAVGDSADEMGANLPVVDLGTGSKAVQVACQEDYTCAVLQSGAVTCWGAVVDRLVDSDYDYEPREIGLGTGTVVVQIACGWFHACVLLDTGAVKCFGKRKSLGLADGPRP